MIMVSVNDKGERELSLKGNIATISANFVTIARAIVEAISSDDEETGEYFKYFLKDIFADLACCEDEKEAMDAVLMRVIKNETKRFKN